jgi:hypothetical protein
VEESLEDKLRDIEREVEEWKKISSYLADCHVATFEGLLGKKSASKSELRRHTSICDFAIKCLSTGMFDYSRHPTKLSIVIKRLEEALASVQKVNIK